MAEGRTANPTAALTQALVALALLIGLPLVLEPSGTWQVVGAGIAGLVLLGLLFEGVLRFLRSRKPVAFHDSILPDKHIDVETTVVRPPKRKDS